MAQGVLPIQYEEEKASSGVTALGGLLVYLDLIKVSGLCEAIKTHVAVCGKQGWLDLQMMLALIFLNLAGGDCVDDLERLEHDGGFAVILREIERFVLTRKERQAMKARWRRERTRTLPSPSSMSEWLERFHSAQEEEKRETGKAFIPAATEAAARAVAGQPRSGGVHSVASARDGSDAGHGCDAGRKPQAAGPPLLQGVQGLSAAELLVGRAGGDGVLGVPRRQCSGRARTTARPEDLPAARCRQWASPRFRLRSDTAGYQEDLLLYCGEGKDERFGVIEFAVSADVTAEFRKAVQGVKEAIGIRWSARTWTAAAATDQEWAEVCYVPNWAGHSKNRADYRFLAIREPLRQLALGDVEQLPFPTEAFGAKGRFKLFGVVTNRKASGDQVIWWQRERCGKSEEVHSVMKSDLAGGQMPSGLFGANAAWWAIMILAHNLNVAMKRLVLGPAWVAKRMKALRFALIGLPGRVVHHARRLIVRLSAAGDALALLLSARRTIQALARGPSG